MADADDKDEERGSLEVRDDVNGDVYRVRLPEPPLRTVAGRADSKASDARRPSPPARRPSPNRKHKRDSGVPVGWVCAAIAAGLIASFALNYWPNAGGLPSAASHSQRSATSSSAASVASTASASTNAPAGASEAADIPAPPYAYSQLGSGDQARYDALLAAFETRTKQRFTGNGDDSVRIRDCVLADHPELFYVDGTQTWSNGFVEGSFSRSPQAASTVQSAIDAAVARCLAGVPEGADDYAVAKHVYEWLAANVSYDTETANADCLGSSGDASAPSRTIEGALVNGRAVCSGYAKAFQYVLQQRGIPCVVVSGRGKGGPHAWCLAKLDGDYYYVDPTWGDLQLPEDGDSGELNYDYLGVTSVSMARTHEADVPFALPDCTAMADNYYVREGLYFEVPDAARLGSLASGAMATGGSAQVRCANAEVYRQLCDAVASGALSAYLSGGYRYSVSDENLTIAILR